MSRVGHRLRKKGRRKFLREMQREGLIDSKGHPIRGGKTFFTLPGRPRRQSPSIDWNRVRSNSGEMMSPGISRLHQYI